MWNWLSLSGEVVGLFESWDTIPHVPSGIFNNLEQYYESMGKIERIADFVLPGHDMEIFDSSTYP